MIVLGKVSRAIASQIAAALPDGPRVEFERQYYLNGCPGLTEYVELHSSDVDIPHPRGLHAEVARIGTLSPEQPAQFDAVFEGFLTEELRWNKKIFERLCEIEVLPDRRAVDDRYQGKVSELLRERGFASRDWTERMVMTMTEEQARRLSFRYRVLRPVPIPVFDEEQVESR